MSEVESGRRIRVLALLPHPAEAPGTRYRVLQYLPHLQARGIDVTTSYFFDRASYPFLHVKGRWGRKALAAAEGTLRRTVGLLDARRYDVVLLYLWLAPLTFPPFELALRTGGRPVVYDIDDPYYAQKESTVSVLRDAGWIPRLMKLARHVTVASEPIAEFAQQHNAAVDILPTVVDTDKFVPRDFDVRRNPRPVVGWVGSPATARFLEPLYPVLADLAREHDFVVRIVGSGRSITIPGLEVECERWQLAREVDHFRDLDIGLYPLEESNVFARAKHGFKMHMYMSVGVPTVASAVGLNASVARHGETAFLARTPADWRTHLSALLHDEALRRRVGLAGRREVVAKWSLQAHVDRLASILRGAASPSGATTTRSPTASAVQT